MASEADWKVLAKFAEQQVARARQFGPNGRRTTRKASSAESILAHCLRQRGWTSRFNEGRLNGRQHLALLEDIRQYAPPRRGRCARVGPRFARRRSSAAMRACTCRWLSRRRASSARAPSPMRWSPPSGCWWRPPASRCCPAAWSRSSRESGQRLVRELVADDVLQANGKSVPASVLVAVAAASAGNFTSVSTVDGRPTLYAFSSADTLPLVVTTGVPESVLQREWLARASAPFLMLVAGSAHRRRVRHAAARGARGAARLRGDAGVRLMVIPIDHNKPSIPRSRPNPFVLNRGDLWGMGAASIAAKALSLRFFGDYLSGQTVYVFATRPKNVDPMMAIQHGSVWPRLEAMRLSGNKAFLQFVARNLMERIELARDQACVGVEGFERNHLTLAGRRYIHCS